MAPRYRYERAVLDGSKFAVWLARVIGVKPKIVKLDLDAEELAKFRKEGLIHQSGTQEYLPNGDEDL